MPKTDAIEQRKRVTTVQDWILQDLSSTDITKKVLDNGWCSSIRQAKNIISQARAQWTKITEEEMEQKRRFKVLELQAMKNSLNPKYKDTPHGLTVLLSIEKEIIKLEGLVLPQRHILSADNGDKKLAACTINIQMIDTGIPLANREEDVDLTLDKKSWMTNLLNRL